MATPKKYFTEEERREASRIASRKYYHTHIEEQRIKSRERSRKYRLNNPELVKQQRRKCHNKRYNDPTQFVSFILSSLRNREREDGKVVKIGREDIENLIIESNGVCAISGLPLTLERKHNLLASVDRIDSDKGYVKGNVQLVAKCVNVAKNSLSQEQFIAMCKAVVAFNS